MIQLNPEYKDRLYRFAVNGQTGKAVGELPVSKALSRLYFAGRSAGGSFSGGGRRF